MPTEKNVTITVNDDGTIDLQRFAGDPDLAKVKQLVDGLRGSVEELKPKAARVAEIEKLGSPEDIATWKRDAEQAQALRDRVQELEGKTTMTSQERQELEQLRETAKKYEGLDPEKAREALDFQTRTLQERELAAAFETAGFNARAALRLDGIRSLETRVQTEQHDGKPVKVAQVKVGDEWIPLQQHVESEFSDFLPVLKPEEERKVDLPSSRSAKGAPAKNPWARETRNLTEQARILKENPTLARQLQEAAAAS